MHVCLAILIIVFSFDGRKKENFKLKRKETKYRNGIHSDKHDKKHVHCMLNRSRQLTTLVCAIFHNNIPQNTIKVTITTTEPHHISIKHNNVPSNSSTKATPLCAGDISYSYSPLEKWTVLGIIYEYQRLLSRQKLKKIVSQNISLSVPWERLLWKVLGKILSILIILNNTLF